MMPIGSKIGCAYVYSAMQVGAIRGVYAQLDTNRPQLPVNSKSENNYESGVLRVVHVIVRTRAYSYQMTVVKSCRVRAQIALERQVRTIYSICIPTGWLARIDAR